jgi:hypothetical protein
MSAPYYRASSRSSPKRQPPMTSAQPSMACRKPASAAQGNAPRDTRQLPDQDRVPVAAAAASTASQPALAPGAEDSTSLPITAPRMALVRQDPWAALRDAPPAGSRCAEAPAARGATPELLSLGDTAEGNASDAHEPEGGVEMGLDECLHRFGAVPPMHVLIMVRAGGGRRQHAARSARVTAATWLALLLYRRTMCALTCLAASARRALLRWRAHAATCSPPRRWAPRWRGTATACGWPRTRPTAALWSRRWARG